MCQQKLSKTLRLTISVHQRHLVCTAGTVESAKGLFHVSYGANHSDESTRQLFLRELNKTLKIYAFGKFTPDVRL